MHWYWLGATSHYLNPWGHTRHLAYRFHPLFSQARNRYQAFPQFTMQNNYFEMILLAPLTSQQRTNILSSTFSHYSSTTSNGQQSYISLCTMLAPDRNGSRTCSHTIFIYHKYVVKYVNRHSVLLNKWLISVNALALNVALNSHKHP